MISSMKDDQTGVRPSLPLALLKLARPKQWVKNAYLFAAVLFAGLLFTNALFTAFLGFLCFALASSSVYVLNDIVDAERDKLHPKKRLRPIPSGAVTKPVAWVYLAFLTAVWLPASFLLAAEFGSIISAYFVMNLAYSLKLKHVFLLDVIIIAVGFVLRAVAGAVMIHVPVSPWLFVCTILLSLFLALGKRRNELGATAHREVLQYYTVGLIDQFLAAMSGTTIMAYSLYTFFAGKDYMMMWTIPFVVYGLFRYLYLIHSTELSGSPEEALLTDKPMLINVLLWGAAAIGILYW